MKNIGKKMVGNRCIIFLCLIFFSSIVGQEKIDSISVKTNQVVFANFSVIFSQNTPSLASIGFDLNYQYKNNLFTFRLIENYEIERARDFILLIFPTDLITNNLSEYALLYGKRYIEEDFAYHFSAGFSYNEFTRDDNGDVTTKTFVGLPLQIGVNWFKAKKEKFRILDAIPVGKPTGFGRAIGLNLIATISKKSYVGLGLSFGLGWHKIYENEK
ncbi:MAG: hypothetical protein NWQ31_12570 [Polaribacter sp.]|nr:hypothetical protein [Polaribacter sp.]